MHAPIQMRREDPSAHGLAREHLGAAKAGLREVRRLLTHPSPENVEQSSSILREIEVQLGCVAAILQSNGPESAKEFHPAVEELQAEVAILARFLSEADKLLSGWLRAVQSRRGGYTHDGRPAPLVLVNKMTVEG